MRVLLIVGTAREGRSTVKVADAVKSILEESHFLAFYDLKEKDIPPLGNRTYKEDEEPVPEDVEELGREVESADTVLIVSPEYNHGIPGVLKNALDYLYPEYRDKLFSYVTVSAGNFGGVRLLEKLHSFTVAVDGVIGPSLNVSNVYNHFDEEGVDGEYEERIRSFVDGLEEKSSSH